MKYKKSNNFLPNEVILNVSYFLYPKGDVKKCKLCEGNCIIYVWRSDLEDFDEVICPECKDAKNSS